MKKKNGEAEFEKDNFNLRLFWHKEETDQTEVNYRYSSGSKII